MSRRRRRLRLHRSGPWIGVVGLVVVLWLSISTAIYAPWWAVVLVCLLLVPQAVVLRRLALSRPQRCPWVPVVGAVVWFAVVLAGAQWWGWST
jgi:hypothetical protein